MPCKQAEIKPFEPESVNAGVGNSIGSFLIHQQAFKVLTPVQPEIVE